MALSIKNTRAETLVRQLALQDGSSITSAIALAVDNELKRRSEVSPEERARRFAAIGKIQDRIAAQPIDWSLTDDEILGYDENGVPT